MPLVDVERYEDDVVPFLDVAVCDDNESVIGSHSASQRSSSSEIPRIISSMPSAVMTSITNTEDSTASDDELSCAHSVRTNKSHSQLKSVSVRSRRFFSSIVSLDESGGDKLISSKSSRQVGNRFDLTTKCDSGCSDVSEDDDRISYLETEVARLNAELTTSQSDHATAKVESRQTTVELEDLQAFCQRLQEQNKRLQEENAALRRGGGRRWFGLQPLKHEANESASQEEKSDNGVANHEQTEEMCNPAAESVESSPEAACVSDQDERKKWWGFGAQKRQSTEGTLPVDEESSDDESD